MRIFFLFLMVVLGMSSMANAMDLQSFSKLPIMHEGRLKPIDSFARAQAKYFSGSESKATQWLVEVLFNPANAENIKAIKIVNPDVLNMLELDIRKNHLYSYRELSAQVTKHSDVLDSIVKTPEDDWTSAQRDFIEIQKKFVSYGELLSSLSLYLPLAVQIPVDAPKSLKAYVNTPLTYMDILKFQETLQNTMKDIIKRKGDNIERYTSAEQDITVLSFTTSNLRMTGDKSKVFSVIPLDNGLIWISPWQTILGEGSVSTKPIFDAWYNLAGAYHTNDLDAWDAAIENINELTVQHIENETTLNIEYWFNIISPMILCAFFYALTIIFLILSHYKYPITLENMARWSFGVGVLFHAAAILTRMYILQRPPVSTLYESIIFVGVVVAFYGLILFWKNKKRFWGYIGAGGALFLTLLSYTHDQDGDSMMMLSAVLNTNFWLATHVICITLGYAFCLITSVLAHIALVNKKHNLSSHLNVAALISLLLAALGTVLGGIWADQSWGRFWGWDPKENGALLITLWLIWIIHAKLSGQMSSFIANIGYAYLSVIVALSWFGVNLLNVGLHAYGFTDAAVWGLIVFIGLETLFVAFVVAYHNFRKSKNA